MISETCVSILIFLISVIIGAFSVAIIISMVSPLSSLFDSIVDDWIEERRYKKQLKQEKTRTDK